MNAYLLGAGASKSYDISKSKQSPPLAKDFFRTFNRLDISMNGWVLIGHIVNFVKKTRGISESDFMSYDGDIEELHSDIQKRYLNAISEQDNEGIFEYGGAYNQLVFLFCSVINETQNGDESLFHKNLVRGLNPNDAILTFNWDTLIDKSLRLNTDWSPVNGYGLTPEKIFRNQWIDIQEKGSENLLIKLHGSTNWLSSYVNYNYKTKRIDLNHHGENDLVYIYENAIDPYPCFDGRFMDGYKDFAMGYYPPNLPLEEQRYAPPKGKVSIKSIPRFGHNPKGSSSEDGMVSMPIIIPPVKDKSYKFYGNLFPNLWKKAQDILENADQIFILGYSFPATDESCTELFKRAFSRRQSIPRIIIVNPSPEDIVIRPEKSGHGILLERGSKYDKTTLHSRVQKGSGSHDTH